MAAQLSVRLLFLSGDEEGDGGDVGCFLGLCGCHLGCVAVQLVYVDYPFICGGFGFLCGLFWRCGGGCFVRCGECGEEGGDGVVFRWRFCVFRGIRRGGFWSFWVGCAVVCVFVLNG